MLVAPRFRDGFVAYLDERSARALADRQEFEAAGDGHGRNAAESWSDFYERAKRDFVETYDQDLLSAVARRQKIDRIGMVVSAATHGYLPLLGRDESIGAKLASGSESSRSRSASPPRAT